MSEGDRSVQESANDEPLSFDQGVEALENIFDPPEEDQVKDEKPEQEEGNEEAEANADVDLEEPSEELEQDETDDQDPDEVEEDDDEESIELVDDTIVDLGNGKQATLADLKSHYGQVEERIAGFQREHTAKAMELADNRKEVEAQSQRVLNWAEHLKQQSDTINALQQTFMPQPPSLEMREEDPYGYMVAKDDYDRKVAEINAHQQKIQHIRQQELQNNQQNQQEVLGKEREKLFEAAPELKDPERFEKYRKDSVEIFADKYGFTNQEMSEVIDHRLARVIRDNIEYEKLLRGRPKAKAKIANKPPVLRAGKSLSKTGKATKAKQQRASRLRETGSLEAGIDALMDFDL